MDKQGNRLEPIGKRKRGRLRRLWGDEVDEAMKKKGLEEEEWHNRRIENLKNRKVTF